MAGHKTQLKEFARQIPFANDSDSSFTHFCTFCVAAVQKSGNHLRKYFASQDDGVQEMKKNYKDIVLAITNEKKELEAKFVQAKKKVDELIQANVLFEAKMKKMQSLIDAGTNERVKVLEQQVQSERSTNATLGKTADSLRQKAIQQNDTIRSLDEKIKVLSEENELLREANPSKRMRKDDDPNKMECSTEENDSVITRLENSLHKLESQQARMLAIMEKSNANPKITFTARDNDSPVSRPVIQKPIQFSLARLMKNSEENAKFIRHINGKGKDKEDRTRNFEKFRRDTRVTVMPIEVIREKGPTSVTIRLPNMEAIATLEKFIDEHAAELVELKGIQNRPAMIKIVQIPTEIRDKMERAAQIRELNPSLRELNFTVEQIFEITNGGISYVNSIISCDIEVQEFFITLGSIAFGIGKCRVYEHIEILQCNNCSQYGHIAINCSNRIACRKCGEAHRHTVCESSALKCTNCVNLNNVRNTNLDTAHNAAHDLCYARRERINEIKRLITPKN